MCWVLVLGSVYKSGPGRGLATGHWWQGQGAGAGLEGMESLNYRNTQVQAILPYLESLDFLCDAETNASVLI